MRITLENVNHSVTGFACSNGTVDTAINASFLPNAAKQIGIQKICINEETVGYHIFTIGTISVNNIPNTDPNKCDFGSYGNKYAAFIVKYLAIGREHQGKEYGTKAMTAILQFFLKFCSLLPIRYIAIEALPECAAWYEEIGFLKTLAKTSEDCVIMYYDAIEEDRAKELKERFSN